MSKPRDPLFVAGIDRLLLERAGREAARASTSQSPWVHGGHAITAIILAGAAAEAHIGEWLARPSSRRRFTAAELKDFRGQPANEVMKAVIKKRTPKYSFGDGGWYRDLTALHQLRNHVVHYYPSRMETGTFPRGLEPHVGNGATFRPVGNDKMDWTSRLIVKSVALKAVEVVGNAVAHFDEAVRGW